MHIYTHIVKIQWGSHGDHGYWFKEASSKCSFVIL